MSAEMKAKKKKRCFWGGAVRARTEAEMKLKGKNVRAGLCQCICKKKGRSLASMR